MPAVAEAAERQREADEEEPDEAEAEDGEVRAHHVGGVLRPAEAGLDEREAGLHEDHQDGADDDPQQVDVLGQGHDGIHLLLREGDGRQEHGAGETDAGGGDDSSCTFGHSVLQWMLATSWERDSHASSGAVAARIASAT